jgi:anti-anti-sigma factor
MTKPTFILDKSGTENKLSATGDLGIHHAHQLKSMLLQAIDQPGDVTMSFEEITSIDTASIQIAYALKREIEKRGRKLIFSLPLNKSVCDLLAKTGITKIL